MYNGQEACVLHRARDDTSTNYNDNDVFTYNVDSAGELHSNSTTTTAYPYFVQRPPTRVEGQPFPPPAEHEIEIKLREPNSLWYASTGCTAVLLLLRGPWPRS